MLESFKFHHIGIAVKNIENTAALYVAGGYIKSSVTFDPIQNVNICWLYRDGMPTIELLEPVDSSSPINLILQKNGVTPYHTCYVTKDLEISIRELRKLHYIKVDEPNEAVAIKNSRVVFLFNKNIGLIELVEEPALITE